MNNNMKYSELINTLNYLKKISGEENPKIVVADSYKSDEYPIRKIEPFYGKIGIIINT